MCVTDRQTDTQTESMCVTDRQTDSRGCCGCLGMNMRSSLSQQDSKIRRLRPRGPDLSTTSNITYSSIKQQLHHATAAAAAATRTSSIQHASNIKQMEQLHHTAAAAAAATRTSSTQHASNIKQMEQLHHTAAAAMTTVAFAAYTVWCSSMPRNNPRNCP